MTADAAPDEVAPREAEPLSAHRIGATPDTVREEIRCLTSFVVYMELDGRVVLTGELGDAYHRLRPPDISDMVTMLGRARVEAEAKLAYDVAQERAANDEAERDRRREAGDATGLGS